MLNTHTNNGHQINISMRYFYIHKDIHLYNPYDHWFLFQSLLDSLWLFNFHMITLSRLGVQHYMHKIIHSFCLASGVYMKISKSLLINATTEMNIVSKIVVSFVVEVVPIDDGFKYIGFHLKPKNYGIQDWYWLIDKFKFKLTNWSHKWLMIGGKLILVQSVLQTILSYWMHLYILPHSIINWINSII